MCVKQVHIVDHVKSTQRINDMHNIILFDSVWSMT